MVVRSVEIFGLICIVFGVGLFSFLQQHSASVAIVLAGLLALGYAEYSDRGRRR